ncbi:EC1118_1K5_1728p [Saccharomyces cerevisiae EC1118]|uniref:EC1118_1K5_1728p n=1 Tax=Saccharomyces cerevisiae (strain Lalvin EC1118 / Prise de mousse) TaxID=643680 RepID=C8ZCA2_YEAS8|nr:EC1118_1K5_1728p [Saccharomyces cerevisiae EC1118]
MYIPKHFESMELSRYKLSKKPPLGTLFSSKASRQGFFGWRTSSNKDDPDFGMCASHIPFVFVEFDNGEHKLIAHLARKNKQVEMLERVQKCLVVFQSVDSYISPAWYPMKKKTHKFVPTWDFAAVHVYGTPRIIRDDKDWLINMLSTLTDQEEEKRPEGEMYEEKWSVSDAPDYYINAMLQNIVGLEISITHIQSKFKFDQNKSQINVEGIC